MFGVASGDIAWWLEVPPARLAGWEAGDDAPSPGEQEELDQLALLAILVAEHTEPGVATEWFTSTELPALDRISVRTALESGWDPTVICDLVRLEFGGEPQTPEVRALAAGELAELHRSTWVTRRLLDS